MLHLVCSSLNHLRASAVARLVHVNDRYPRYLRSIHSSKSLLWPVGLRFQLVDRLFVDLYDLALPVNV